MTIVLSLLYFYNYYYRTPKPLVYTLIYSLRITPVRISPKSIDSGDKNLLALKIILRGHYRR